MRVESGLILLALALLPGCSAESPVDSTPTPAGGVTVSPAIIELVPGGVLRARLYVRDASNAVVEATNAQWRSTNNAVATLSGDGTVTAVAVGNAGAIGSAAGKSDTADVRVVPPEPTGAAIDVFPEVSYQVMTGWEGTAQIGESQCNGFATFKDALLDRLVNELGIDRVRIHVRSGHENPVDHYSQYLQTRNTADWNPFRFASVNDNNDPNVANPAGFQFAEIDHKVTTIVNPMRALLQARGERLYVNLNYVDFGVSAWEQSSDPAEYAELILATFMHLRDRYGWVPDALEISLEPDNTPNWRPDVIGRALVAAGDRLKAAGFRPHFIAPSNTNMTSALQFFDDMIKVPRVLEYLTDIAYHRYSGVSDASLTAIAQRATALGLRTAMLEHINSGDQDLYRDLSDGLNSSWQQFALAFCTTDNGAQYYVIDDGNAAAPNVTLSSRSRALRQYFAFIRQGARRIGAASGDQRLQPLAFRNTNGKVVVVVRASSGGPVPVRRLPPGTYRVVYTTAQASFVSLPDVVVGTAGTLDVSIPAGGVITFAQR